MTPLFSEDVIKKATITREEANEFKRTAIKRVITRQGLRVTLYRKLSGEILIDMIEQYL